MAQERRTSPERRRAPERRAAPRAARSQRSPARVTRTPSSSGAGTDAATRRAAGAARVGQILQGAERSPDARAVTEGQTDTGPRVAHTPSERRRRQARADSHSTGGTPKLSREARETGPPAPTPKAGSADGRARDPGRPQPRSGPGGIAAFLSAGLRRTGAALRGLASRFGGAQRAVSGALQAVLAGRNPVLAAIKAWFAALSTPVKFLVIAGLVLLALLAPLLLLLLLLALAVAVVVIAVRAPATV